MATTEWYSSVGTIPSYNDAVTELATLASENTAWTFTTIGTSEQSRDIKAMIVHPTGYTRTIMLTSEIHGLEKLTTRAALDFLHYLAANTSLYTSIRFIVIPMVNPDGYYLGQRKNANDVDLNRNFPTGWGETGGNPVFNAPSTDPSSDNYMGTDDLTESESIALAGAIDTYLGAGDVLLDCHTTMNLLLMDTGSTYKNVVRAANDYLRTNEHLTFTYNESIPTGMMYSYAGAAGAYSFVVELDAYAAAGNVVEVNRYIGWVKALAENSYAADAENNFASDTSCVAVWNFENPDITVDSKDTNHLTLGGGATLSTIAMQGATGLRTNATNIQQAYRTDANLASGFPGKSGETNRDFTIVFDFYPIGYPGSGANSYMCSKWASTAAQRALSIGWFNNSGTIELRVMIGYGAGYEYTVVKSGALTLNAWYKVAVAWNNATRTLFAKLVDASNAEISKITNTTSFTHDLFCGTAPFAFNCAWTSITESMAWANSVYDGAVVFNDVKTESEIDQIFAGTYVAAGGGGEISASLSGSSTSAGTLLGAGSLSASIAASSSMEGTLGGEAVGSLAASVVGSASVSGTALGAGSLSSLISGTSTFDATINSEAVGQLSALVFGSSSVAGTVTAQGQLSSIAAGESGLSGTLIGEGRISSGISASSDVSGLLTGIGSLRTTMPGIGTLEATGTTTGSQTLQAFIRGIGTITGTLNQPLGESDYYRIGKLIELGFRASSRRGITRIGRL
jgi:predicted deacylase